MRKVSDLDVLPVPQKTTFHGESVERSALRGVAQCGHLPSSFLKQVRRFTSRNRLRAVPRTHASIFIGMDPTASPPHPESYVLHIGDPIVLSAADAPGLFHGLQTLQQLLDADEAIPRCTVEDWPVLRVRGFYFDLTRQVPTTDYLKVIVDRLAAVKINLLMVQYREFFPYEGFPLIVSAHSYTPKEVAEFVRYANERHIQVVPLLQSLSFQEHVLRSQAFTHLRETPGAISGLCPTHPESFPLYRSLAEQLMAAHPTARYFHMGADEANSVGQCERCRRVQAQTSKAALVTGFTGKVIPFLLDHNVKPIMWADMLFGHLEDAASVPGYVRHMFAELSRDVIAADWDYWSTGPRTPPAHRSPYEGIAGLSHLDRLLEAGFEVLGAPSCSSYGTAERNALDHGLPFRNITAFAKQLRRRRCLGMLNTFWPTSALVDVWSYAGLSGNEVVSVRYKQPRPGLEAHWYNIWRGAECAWSSTPRSRQDYDRVFARTFLGAGDTDFPDALNLASFPMGGPGSGRRVPKDETRARLRRAVVRIQRAERSAARAASTVAYSGLFLRIQEHAARWREFHHGLARVDAPKLSQTQMRKLRKLVAERELLESDFRRTYVTIYKAVHLEEEARVRFAEERRIQEQLLWEQKRRTR